MEPRIQYAQTKDGVSIAFWAMGDGVPLVGMVPISHVQLEWRLPALRRWYERLTERTKLVRYDTRGTGLSDRDVTDFSLEAHVLDLEAVVDHLGFERFALFAMLQAGPAAITYAVRYPERVSHLILWETWARGSDMVAPELRGLGRLLNTNWKLYTETVAHGVMGWSEGEPARLWAEIMREATTQAAYRESLDAARAFDVAALLPQVRSPTLVLHRRHAPLPDVEVVRGLASRIPDARLALLEGSSAAPWLEDWESVAAAIVEFLSEGEEAAAGAAPLAAADVHTILFTDVEGSTDLTQRLGDAKARVVLRQHERIVREALKSHGGSELKTIGDGFMASFSSAVRALECAIAMQRAFEQRNQSAEQPLLVRVGLNAGEPIAEDEDLFGAAVNLAARITAEAKGGQILASEAVRQIVAGKKFLFSDRGETTLRGFEDPVHIYEVSWREA